MSSVQAITLCVCVMIVLQYVLTSPGCIECGGKIKHRRGCKRGAV